MKTTTKTPERNTAALADQDLIATIRRHLSASVLWQGQRETCRRLGVSRHTLWRFMERGHVGRVLPRAVLDAEGESVEAVEAATRWVTAMGLVHERARLKRLRNPDAPDEETAAATRHLPQGLRDALTQLCAAPLATVSELATFNRVPPSTMRERLAALARRGLANSVPHHLGALGRHPQRRHFPTGLGIRAAAKTGHGVETLLQEYPVSRQWFRLLAERLDAVAVLYRVAALIADVEQSDEPMRVHHCRQGPYDMIVALSGGRTIGLVRQGPVLTTANLRYRLRSIELLHRLDRTTVTLVLAYADQPTRRAVRALTGPSHIWTTFAAREDAVLAGCADAPVWQECGPGRPAYAPRLIAPDASLRDVLSQTEALLTLPEMHPQRYRLRDPATLRRPAVRTSLPEPSKQLASTPAVQLTGAEKETLDLLAAWPLCTTEQVAGLLGGITRRRTNQLLQSLTQRNLVRADGPRLVLTDAGLACLARRDRAAVGLALDRWSAEPSRSNPNVYAGTALRTMAAQMAHHDAITGFAAALAAEAAHARGYDLFDLLPTARSTIGYRYRDQNFVVHPDASFQLAYKGRQRPYLLEVERRATTPRRARARLENYRRYFLSGWADQDHGRELPLVLFLFETPDAELVFLQAAARLPHIPLCASTLPIIARRGVLGNAWRLPPPQPPRRRPLRLLDSRQIVPAPRSLSFL